VIVVNLFFIESQQDYNLLSENLRNEDVFLYAVSCSTTKHPVVDEASVLFMYTIKSKKNFIIVFDHSDSVSDINRQDVYDLINSLSNQRYVVDKKSFCQVCNICDTIDINILSYATKFEYLEFDNIDTTAHRFYNILFPNCNVINKIISIAKHFEKFMKICESALDLLNENAYDIQFDSFLKLNKDIVDTLCSIEKSGLCVDTEKFKNVFGDNQMCNIHDGMVYSQYNIFTSTGRPSNRYGGINFAALNKQDDTRECFVSRFKEHGKLIDMDFSAFHPRLITNLINYNLSIDTNIYEYLARFYFNKENVTDKNISQSKQITFRQLYGGIESKYLKIPFFEKTQKFIDQKWEFFQKNGYVETPVYNRMITEKNLGSEINTNKVFNYILQSFEVETAMKKAAEILYLLRNYQSVLCLYTYDSLLFDFHKDDTKELLIKIRNIMQEGGYPVKIKAGDNYKHMKEISL
jgi:hypothetical protein